MMIARVLRVLAFAIILAGAVDPAVPWPWTPRGSVALIDTGDAHLTGVVAAALRRDFDVHDGSLAGAAATVIAGDAMPVEPPAVSGALVGVLPSPRRPRIEMQSVIAAPAAPGTRVPVHGVLRAVGLKGQSLDISLRSGSLVLDHRARPVVTNDESVAVDLEMPSPAAGVSVAEVSAAAGVVHAVGAVAIESRDTRWRVLVSDARPSWASTFVRRALEVDRRFDVASRVETSRSIAAESGAAPAIADGAALDAFDAIVIGAPDALATAEVAALDRYARRRGGAVVLLMDAPGRGAFAALTGAAGWRDERIAERRTLETRAGSLVATELALFDGPAADVHALASSRAGDAVTPVVWETPAGAGRVIVNGALDAWRYRGGDNGGFARFWVDAIAGAAAASPAPLSIDLPAAAVAAGASVPIRVAVRDVQLSDPARAAAAATVGASIADGAAPTPIRLWPSAERGVFVGTIRAPRTPGTYAVSVDGAVTGGAAIRATAVLTVADSDVVARERLADRWVTSRGGIVMSEDDVAGVTTAIRAASGAAPVVAGHPMRSPWWIAIVVTMLGAEWWIRRRRGER